MENILVSIITVTYQAQDHLEQTMQSVFTQTYPNIEYILIDGGSTDKTLDIVRKHENKLSFWVSEKDNGIYDAMNKGIQKAQGELIGMINASDYYEPEAVELMVSTYIKNPDFGVYHGNVNMLNTDGSFFKFKKPNTNIDELYKGMSLYHPTFFIPKSTYEHLGLYSLQFKIAADFDLALRYYLAGVKFYWIDSVICNFRKGGVSTKQEVQATQECVEVLLKNGYPEAEVQTISKKWEKLNKKDQLFDMVYQLLKKILPEAVIKKIVTHVSINNKK